MQTYFTDVSKLRVIALATTPFVLTACASFWNIDEDVPPPPPIREVRQLKVPADLVITRPAPNPYTAALVATQVPPPGPQSAATGASAASPEPVAKDKEAAPREPMLFAPYFPTATEATPPAKWELRPAYDFPWIAGAESSRVNEETVMGSGSRMIGRLFARISYENQIPLPAESPAAKPVSPSGQATEAKAAPEGVFDRLRNRVFGKSAPEPVKKDVPSNAPKFVVCDGATCLDSARDALMADAATKGWELLLNRRVSLHQSFQFRKSDRVLLIELSSDGKKKLEIEYGLLPSQK